MTWLLWRQHRRQGLMSLAILAALGILLWLTGIRMANIYHDAVSNCSSTDTCGDLVLFQGWGPLIDLVNFTVLVPALVGVFWGATIVGRELDNGTNRLVWTQSVTRRTWMRSKVLLLLVSSVAIGAMLSGLVTWWSGTLNSYHHNRFEGLPFDIQGLMPVAYTLFAAALGLACGVLWRRTLPAIATTIGVFFVTRLVVEGFVRPHLRAPLTLTSSLGAGSNGAPPGSWVMSTAIQLHGQVLHGSTLRLPESCASSSPTRAAAAACLRKLGYAQVTKYQPAGRYWSFQLTEAAIFLVLTAILTTVAMVALKRQDG